MALDRPYCTLEEVQKECHSSGSELNSWYSTCINLASRWVEEHCQRQWLFLDHETEALLLDREWVMSDEIFLPFPLITLTSLEVDGYEWDADDYYWKNSARGTANITSESGDFGRYPFRGELKLKGTFGYAPAEDPTTNPPPKLPIGVRRATCLIASAFSSEKHIEQVALDGTRAEILDTRIPLEAKKLLKEHIRTAHLC